MQIGPGTSVEVTHAVFVISLSSAAGITYSNVNIAFSSCASAAPAVNMFDVSTIFCIVPSDQEHQLNYQLLQHQLTHYHQGFLQ